MECMKNLFSCYILPCRPQYRLDLRRTGNRLGIVAYRIARKCYLSQVWKIGLLHPDVTQVLSRFNEEPKAESLHSGNALAYIGQKRIVIDYTIVQPLAII